MINRRQLLTAGSSLLVSGFAASRAQTCYAQQPLTPLEVASAGSFRAMLDGPLKTAARQTLKLDLHPHAQGADAVAQSLLSGTLLADVFIPITVGPMLTLMRGGRADTAQPIARTELVIAYSPKSRFAAQLSAASRGEANWWEVLQRPGLRFARSNPSADPSGRAILFALMLAAQKYHQPGLVDAILGPPMNPQQVLTGINVHEGLVRGELDAAPAYKASIVDSGLPFLALAADINLSSGDPRAEHPDLSLSLGGKVFYPEALIFYAAILTRAANPAGAAAFADWLRGKEARAILTQNSFHLPGDAPPLHL